MSVRIIVGDALAALRALPSESVQVCVTSPPYFQLRDYGVDGQIGLEQTPAAFLGRLVTVFDEVKRVLHRDGLCFVNLGDSYAGSGKGPTTNTSTLYNGRGVKGHEKVVGRTAQLRQGFHDDHVYRGIPAKNLLLIPERFAIAMQDAGWYVRSRIAWCKTSAMPESVRDRPTSAWEHVWMFAKSRTYFYDAEAVRQVAMSFGRQHTTGVQPPKVRGYAEGTGQERHRGDLSINYERTTANLRNYWLLGPEPLRDEHFAAYPTELVKRCVLAGSRKGDTVLDPFGGSGTTGLVADRLERNAVLIELNPAYAEMARKRIAGDAPLWTDVSVSDLESCLPASDAPAAHQTTRRRAG